MPQVFAVIGVVAGAVGSLAGTGALLAGTGTFLGMTAATLTTVATIASVVSAVAMLGTMIFKPKPPPARGSVTKILVDPDAPAPYAMGEGPVGGVLRHDAGYGATLNGVPNPYRWLVTVLSVAGPVAAVTPWADMAAVSGYYSGFLYTDTKLGAVPESSALAPHWSGAPGWDSTSKLSGKASIGWSLLFDRAGKVFSSGLPKLAGYGQWVKVYDPRLDSTFPGGSGSQRFDDETTWAWSENPALHALAYARGRFVSGVKVMGVGIPKEGLDLVATAAWASVCDANAWKIFGVVYEPGDRWANLKDICMAGGGEPVFSGGVLSWKYAAPKVSLDTITEEDLTDGDHSVTPMASWRERINTIIPKYRSPDHDWELVDADAIVVSSYVTADGSSKKQNWPFNLVKNVNQAAQLARYRLEDSREIMPIEITVKPRLRAYRPGECLHVTLPQLGLNHDCVILKREIDPGTMAIKLTLMTETSGKHSYALGQTGTAPAIPALVQDQADRDAIAGVQLDVVSQLSPATGNALSSMTDTNGRTLTKLADAGTARNGDVVTFSSVLPNVPYMNFLPGGNAATAGQNVVIQAVGLSTSGFTLKAVSQVVTAGSTITDSTVHSRTGGDPDIIITRSNSGAPFDGYFQFNYTVTVGDVAPGEPGSIHVAFYVRQSGAWVTCGSASHSSSASYSRSYAPGTVDYSSGAAEFGISVISTTGSGTTLDSLDSVKYTLGTVTETSLTPSGASAIPWQAWLQ